MPTILILQKGPGYSRRVNSSSKLILSLQRVRYPNPHTSSNPPHTPPSLHTAHTASPFPSARPHSPPPRTSAPADPSPRSTSPPTHPSSQTPPPASPL